MFRDVTCFVVLTCVQKYIVLSYVMQLHVGTLYFEICNTESYTVAGQADCFCGALAGEQPAQEEERSAPGDPGRDHSVEISRF